MSTREDARKVLAQWLAEGQAESMFEVACTMAPEMNRAKQYLLGLWEEWVEGERTARGMKACVHKLVTCG